MQEAKVSSLMNETASKNIEIQNRNPLMKLITTKMYSFTKLLARGPGLGVEIYEFVMGGGGGSTAGIPYQSIVTHV